MVVIVEVGVSDWKERKFQFLICIDDVTIYKAFIFCVIARDLNPKWSIKSRCEQFLYQIGPKDIALIQSHYSVNKILIHH